MRGGGGFLIGALAASVLAWLALDDLTAAVRLWSTMLLVPFPALMVLQARLVTTPAELRRGPLYFASALTQWLLALATLLVAVRGGFSVRELGLFSGHVGVQLAWAAVIVVLAECVYLVAHRLGVRESPLMAVLLPRTAGERAGFAALSLTAGICEELLFRGFLMTVLSVATGSLTMALVVTALTFGVTHAYQEPAGAARATLLGLFLAAPVVATGSLLGAMIAHAAIDIIGGFWLGPRLAGPDR